MNRPLLIRALRLQGAGGQFEYRFDTEDGDVRPVAVVAGPMRTGKSSLLGFIDWCLGDSKHPDHPHFSTLTMAMLEVDLNGKRRVIARRLFDEKSSVQLHSCGLSDLRAPHAVAKHPVSLPSDPESLSAVLVQACGLDGSVVRRRPSAADSETNSLSYRNLSWLSYLPSRRLNDHVLLNEDRPQDKMHQYRQTLDLAFGVSDDALNQVAARLSAAKARVSSLDSQITAVERFLGNQFEENRNLEDERTQSETRITELEGRLSEIDRDIRAADSFPEELRQRAAEASEHAAEIGRRVRDRRGLLKRLAPLRHQYVEELRKLNFVQEAGQILDPLPVVRCPVCSSALEAPGISHGSCELCGQSPKPDGDDTTLDLSAEVRSIESRLRELTAYIAEIEDEATQLESEMQTAKTSESTAQAAIDKAAKAAVTPFLAERDSISTDLADARASLARLLASAVQQEALTDLQDERRRAEAEAQDFEAESTQLASERPSREAVIEAVGKRFESLLSEAAFPDLHEARVDENYAPMINERHYSAETSTGAQTLISVCWQLAVYEILTERDGAHPGHLMIDSIQQGLAQQPTPGGDDRFSDPAIVERLYQHMRGWADARKGDVQVIVVDQSPPVSQRDLIAVEFTRDPDRPPGWIVYDVPELLSE
jgi:outer membrane murein-binding lipoprotein Lpp